MTLLILLVLLGGTAALVAVVVVNSRKNKAQRPPYPQGYPQPTPGHNQQLGGM